jgi:hypothetical protein
MSGGISRMKRDIKKGSTGNYGVVVWVVEDVVDNVVDETQYIASLHGRRVRR